jgi:glycosyltransferase involved in cell wall biosynthesis
MPLISIITPVYNAAEHLEKCLESILKQTFKDFELLIINDGSADASGRICDMFAEKDNRIRVFHTQNRGVSAARNLGLSSFKGKFVCFVDADDWIEGDYLSTFYKQIDSKNSLVINNYINDTLKSSKRNWDIPDTLFLKNDFNALFIELDLVRNGVSCAKLYNGVIIRKHQITFNSDVAYAEDFLFMLQYLKHVDSVSYSSYAGYHYQHYNTGSLSKTHNSFEAELNSYLLIRKELDEAVANYLLNQETQVYIDAWLSKFFLRSIQSFYRRTQKTLLVKRIESLKFAYNIGHKQILNLDRSLLPYHKLLPIYLFRRKSFYTFDLYMRFFVYVRKLKWQLLKSPL